MQLEQFAIQRAAEFRKPKYCRGTSPVRSSVRKSLVFRIPHVGKPHRPNVRFGSRADSTVTVSIRPLLGLKPT